MPDVGGGLFRSDGAIVAERPPIRLLSHTGPGTWGWCIIGHPLPFLPPEPENFRTGVRMKLLPNCNINVRFKVEMYNRKWDASYVRLRGNRSERGKGKHETDTYKREGSD